MIEKIENATIYKCSHCGKVSPSLSGMKMHDKFCKKNPENVTLCRSCANCVKSYHVGEEESRCGGWMCRQYGMYGDICPDDCDGRIHETRFTCQIDGARMYAPKVKGYGEEKRKAILEHCDRQMPSIAMGCPNYKEGESEVKEGEIHDPFHN